MPAGLTVMPAFWAVWFRTAKLISQPSTAFGRSAAGIWDASPDCCRFDTWVSSDAEVIRSLPTIAAAPTLTGEHAVSSAHAPATAAAAARRDFLPGTGASLRSFLITR